MRKRIFFWQYFHHQNKRIGQTLPTFWTHMDFCVYVNYVMFMWFTHWSIERLMNSLRTLIKLFTYTHKLRQVCSSVFTPTQRQVLNICAYFSGQEWSLLLLLFFFFGWSHPFDTQFKYQWNARFFNQIATTPGWPLTTLDLNCPPT